jgi:hypothetical protein
MSRLAYRLAALRNWRAGIATYARFCASSDDPEARVRNWTDLDPRRADAWYRQLYRDNDHISDEVVFLAMRVEAEIAILESPFPDPRAHLEVVRETLGEAVRLANFEKVLREATRKTKVAEQDLVLRARQSGAAVTLRYPRLVESNEIARALNLTRLRKSFIWKNQLRIRAIDEPVRMPATPRFSPEERREHRELAERFGRTVETVADWRRKGPEAFSAKVADVEALLLAPEMIKQHALPGEHPMKTSVRVRRLVRDRERKQAAREFKPSRQKVTARVRLEAAKRGVSQSTIWREKRRRKEPESPPEPVSQNDSDHVTLTVEIPHDFRRNQRRKYIHVQSRKRRPYEKLSREVIEDLKDMHERETGLRVTDAAVRKWRSRDPAKFEAQLERLATHYDGMSKKTKM